ncbi:DMT family transporter [Pseudophaeobacter leonis]|uniref:DMT family transporter n=1 Tax=Pseudophaeobacter leonis TaxID=1144477 RepID=UPI0030C75700
MSKPLVGALMVVVYTGVISSADGITKLLAGSYEAAQIYALSGAVIAVLSVLVCWCHKIWPIERSGHQGDGKPDAGGGVWRTKCPGAMALRSLATLLAASCFFYAFRLLPFAQVFLFIGLMPLMAGALSGVILRERIRPSAWIALVVGFVGVLFLFPGGVSSISAGHFFALMAAGLGTLSMIMARYISRFDSDLLPQVFYPNLALCLAMLPLLPLVWQPMPIGDLAWALSYAALLFAARWLAVAALRLLPAYVVMPLMNLQFIWCCRLGR